MKWFRRGVGRVKVLDYLVAFAGDPEIVREALARTNRPTLIEILTEILIIRHERGLSR